MNHRQLKSGINAAYCWRNRSGQALVEFSLMLLALMVLLFAIIDFGRAFHLKQILINVSREGANLASRGTDFTNTLSAVVISAQPLEIDSDGYIILTKIHRDGNGVATVTQQVGRGGASASSRVGRVGGGSPNLPNSGIPPSNQDLIVAEVFYSFRGITPMGQILQLTLPATFYDVAYF